VEQERKNRKSNIYLVVGSRNKKKQRMGKNKKAQMKYWELAEEQGHSTGIDMEARGVLIGKAIVVSSTPPIQVCSPTV
jgi:hypothetical protein